MSFVQVLLAIFLWSGSLWALPLEMYRDGVRLGAIPVKTAFAKEMKPQDEIWIRSQVSLGAVYQCLTTRKQLASLFADPSFLNLPYETLFEILKQKNHPLRCRTKWADIEISYQGQRVTVTTGVLTNQI